MLEEFDIQETRLRYTVGLHVGLPYDDYIGSKLQERRDAQGQWILEQMRKVITWEQTLPT
jgi:hypothetical protein